MYIEARVAYLIKEKSIYFTQKFGFIDFRAILDG